MSTAGTTIRVVVASRNPVKLGAVQGAFASRFSSASIEVEGIEVASGVADQPVSDAETRLGARQRVANARKARPDADFWVGLEGGIDRVGSHWQAFAWMCIESRGGRDSELRSVSLPLPPGVERLLDAGLELGEANDRVFSTVNSKQGGGAFGLLTDGLYTRESVYRETLVLALVPFVHPLFQAANAGTAAQNKV